MTRAGNMEWVKSRIWRLTVDVARIPMDDKRKGTTGAADGRQRGTRTTRTYQFEKWSNDE